MNRTLALNSFAALIAARTGMDQQQVSGFLTKFAAITGDTLADGESVYIKHIGGFKLSHGQIVFVPDNSLAAQCNSAFAAFAPVELTADMAAALDRDPANASTDAPTQTDTFPQPKDPDPPAALPEDSQAAPGTSAATEAPAPEPDDSPTPQPVDFPSPQPAECTPGEYADDESDQAYQPAPQPAVYVPAIHRHHHRGWTAFWILLAVIVSFAGGAATAYLTHDRIERFVNATPQQPQVAHTVPVTAVPTDTTPAPPLAVTVVDTVPVKLTPADIDDINNTATEPQKQPLYDTVTRNRYLTTMARKYYGHQDYWVYIYEANSAKLRHPDRIRPGTKVLIPDFETYRTSTDPEQNRQDARRKGVEIYARYK